MCCYSINKLTTILLLLLTYLLTTMPSTTITTTAKTTTITTTTTVKVPITATPTTIILSAKEKQLQQQKQEHKYFVNVNAPPKFDVRLRGTLPIHRDNFIASLVNSNHNIHAINSGYHHNAHHISNNNSNSNNIRHAKYYNALSPLDINAIDRHLVKTGDTELTTTVSITYSPPVFDFGVPRNITARAGQTASITCRVDNLGDKSVSWIRKRDLHILTAGILTYTSDERFKVVRTVDSKNWSLHVKYAQPRDSGIYECQVNTEPKISMAFRLNVIVTPPDAKSMIIGPTDLYVKVGSAITLTCLVKQPSSAHDIGPIYWYRGPYVLTPFVAHPNDAAIDLQRISMESKLVEQLQSRLRIANAQTNDSGNYTCMPTTAEAASVMVNVINDESPAAMQKSEANFSNNKYTIVRWCGILTMIFQHLLATHSGLRS